MSKTAKDWAGEGLKWLTVFSLLASGLMWFLDSKISASVQAYTPLDRTERLELRLHTEESDRRTEDQRIHDTLNATQTWVSSNHVETIHALQMIQLQLSNMSNWLHNVKITTPQGQVGGGYAF